ncbi:hypothetical protein KCU87_g98, partial [Aureobasidium melanogenum]
LTFTTLFDASRLSVLAIEFLYPANPAYPITSRTSGHATKVRSSHSIKQVPSPTKQRTEHRPLLYGPLCRYIARQSP